MSDLDANVENLGEIKIETTLGDLICAIHDAASESSLATESLNSVTKLVLETVRLRYEV